MWFMSPPPPQRADLFVTIALKTSPTLVESALRLADELRAPFVERAELGLPKLFAARPDARTALVVRTGSLLLVDRDGHEFFYHPNMAFLRLGNLLRGQRDSLLDAAGLRPGDSVLDCTLGYAAEAILCAYAVGETGEVHGVESVPELGVVVREGLKTVETDRLELNEAMRRVRVVHLGDHLEYLRSCPDRRYDLVYLDPFFKEPPKGSQPFAPIRFFGDHSPLLPETIAEATRVARHRVLVKSERWSSLLEELGLARVDGGRTTKVAYGAIDVD